MTPKASTGRNAAVVIFGAVAMLLAVATLAWACTPRQNITHVTPIAGEARSQVKIEGDGLTQGQPVSITWNSAAGPKLAQTSADASGSFSVTATIPDTQPGVYFLLATTGDNQATVARSVFEVTESLQATSPAGQSTASTAGHSIPSDLWRGFTTSPSGPGSTPNQAPATRSGPGLGLGIALSATAVVMGFAAMTAARKRQKAHG